MDSREVMKAAVPFLSRSPVTALSKQISVGSSRVETSLYGVAFCQQLFLGADR
jgi:hypothetical protein